MKKETIDISIRKKDFEELLSILPFKWKQILKSRVSNKKAKKAKAARTNAKKRDDRVWKEAEEFRAELVAKATEAEKVAKAKLKAAGILYDFQKIIYTSKNKRMYRIVDFYLPKIDLILEIDGKYHNNKIQVIKDKDRTNELGKQYYKIKRLTNETIMKISPESLAKFLIGEDE